jgi:60 kDa SS-A/Ro ribonucleoprotein
MSRYAKHVNTKRTPQTSPIFGEKQVKNNAGGYTYALDKWGQFARFLVLGTAGGTFYVDERKLTVENAEIVLECLSEDGLKVVSTLQEYRKNNRAPTDTLVFVWAMATAFGDDKTRAAAYQAISDIIWTFSQLADAIVAREAMGAGWGHGFQNAVRRWMFDKKESGLALNFVKYRERNGWTPSDVLRMAKPSGTKLMEAGQISYEMNQILKFGSALQRNTEKREKRLSELHTESLAPVIEGYLEIRNETDAKRAAKLITTYNLPHEAVPTELKRDPAVWDALLNNRDMGATAMLRNLGVMSSIGLLTKGSDAQRLIVERLTNEEYVRKSYIHPINFLAALVTYEQGHGSRGSNTWTPVPAVINALDSAFYASFGAVQPTGKRILQCLDVSGSMHMRGMGEIRRIPGLFASTAAAAMILVNNAVEKHADVVAFSHTMVDIDISHRDRLDTVKRKVEGIRMGGTDCSLPMLWAMGYEPDNQNGYRSKGGYVQKREQVKEYDTFIVYTDNETWHGNIHPVQALRDYREKTGIDAKLIVVAMTSTGFTIADPNDKGMLDVVGFDTSAPNIISNFIAS